MKTYTYDTHVHTSETSPCGRVSAAELVRQYKAAGYDGIVITDHYYDGFFRRQLFKSWESKIDRYLAGYRNAAEEGKKAGLDVILGMEIKFEENANDYLVFGMSEEFLRKNRKLYRLGLEGFRRLARENGLMIVQAHPFRPRMIPADPSLLDGIEVYNGNPRHDASNHKAKEYAVEHGLKMTSGSDFHQMMDLARGGMVVRDPVKTPRDLIRAIKGEGLVRLLESE